MISTVSRRLALGAEVASAAVAFVSFLAHALTATECCVVQTISMDVTNVFIRAIRFDLNAVDAVAIVTWSAHALVPVVVLVQLAIGKRMAVVHDIARNYDFQNFTST